MSESTTAGIRERHNAEVCKLNRLPNAIGPKSRFVEAHNDRGTLLERLEAAEATIKRQQAALDALPKWTKITDDPETWPDDGQHYIRSEYIKSFDGWSIPISDIFCAETFKYDYVLFVGDMWRPLCSIDYPPKADRGDV